jgi:hypothetical protein
LKYYQNIDKRILLLTSGDLAIDTEVQEEHQIVADEIMDQLGVRDFTFRAVPFNITAISTGNVEVSLPAIAEFTSQSEISKFINYPPYFDGVLIAQTLIIIEGSRGTLNLKHIYKTPEIKDLEGDEIAYEIFDQPRFVTVYFDSTARVLVFDFNKKAI